MPFLLQRARLAFLAISVRLFALMDFAREGPPSRPPFLDDSLRLSGAVGSANAAWTTRNALTFRSMHTLLLLDVSQRPRDAASPGTSCAQIPGHYNIAWFAPAAYNTIVTLVIHTKVTLLHNFCTIISFKLQIMLD